RGKGGRTGLRIGRPYSRNGTVAERHAAARKPDLAEHAGKPDRTPERLLAMMRPLQAPACADHRAAACHARCKRPYGVRIEPGNGGRPIGGLFGAVLSPTSQIIQIDLMPARAAG